MFKGFKRGNELCFFCFVLKADSEKVFTIWIRPQRINAPVTQKPDKYSITTRTIHHTSI